MSAAAARADRHGWLKILLGPPDSDRDVLVWDSVDEMPMPAFFDAEENSWYSKVNGRQFDDGAVTHWQEIVAPKGVQA